MSETLDGDVITDEMLKRCNRIEGTNGGVEFRVKQRFIIDCLLDGGYIEQHHAWDAQTFMDLRRAYEAFFGIKWGVMRVAEPSAVISEAEVNFMYDTIRRVIGIPRCEGVIAVVIEAMTLPDVTIPAFACDKYRIAIEEISGAVYEANKRNREIRLATLAELC